jgi:hypothetical protein
MNERIKELIAQSTVSMTVREWDEVDHYYYNKDEFKLDPEKFSELIVGECLDIVANADMTELEGPDPEDVLYVACKQIKQYFGVE